MASLTATLVSPSPNVTASGGGNVALVSPKPKFTGGWTAGFPTSAVMTAPMPVLTAQSGHNATLVSPTPVLTAGASVSSMLYAALVSPVPVLTASGRVSNQANATLTAPVPTLQSQSGHNAVMVMSVPTLTATGTTGRVGAFAGRMPMPTLVSAGGVANHGSATLIAPMLRRVTSGQIVLVSPSPRFVASGGPVTTDTHVAYSFNIKPDNRPGWNGVVVVDAVRYPAYPLTKIVRVDDANYGISQSGVHKLTGTTDNGTAIPWEWMTTTSDMGSTKKKTLVSAYIGGEVPQSMRITVRSSDSETDPYAQTVTRPAELINHRQKFGLGRKARYYAIGMSATSGGLELENVELELAEMNRRI